MGQFGVGASPGPCSNGSAVSAGRRLQSRGGGGGGGGGGSSGGNSKSDDGSVLIVDETSEMAFEQQVLVEMMVDGLMSLLLILAVLLGLHLSVLLCWKYRLNRRYYNWAPPRPCRVVTISHNAGENIGIHVNDNQVVHIADGSPCASVLSAGDRIHAVNGQRMHQGRFWRGTGALIARMISMNERVFLLVGAPADPVQAAADAERLFYAKVAAASRSARRVKPWSGTTQSGKARASGLPMKLLPSAQLRTFYEAVSKEVASPPHFRSLPDALFFPNPEVLIFSCFATGVLAAASAVLGAAAAGYATTVRGLAVSIITILMMTIFYAHQGYWLFQFYRKHLANVWVDAEPPESKDEVEDPLFAFLSNVTFGFFKPRPREWGGFEAPEEDTEEPARTERALARAFSLRPVKFGELPSGDALSQLQPWLGDSSGKGKTGIYYMFFMLVLQLIAAVIIGILVVTPYGQTLLMTIIAIQLLDAIDTVVGRAEAGAPEDAQQLQEDDDDEKGSPPWCGLPIRSHHKNPDDDSHE